jgi:hypothetical protein
MVGQAQASCREPVTWQEPSTLSVSFAEELSAISYIKWMFGYCKVRWPESREKLELIARFRPAHQPSMAIDHASA